MNQPNAVTIRLKERGHYIAGYVLGFRQPCLRLVLTIEPSAESAAQALQKFERLSQDIIATQVLNSDIKPPVLHATALPQQAALWLCEWACNLIRQVGLPVVDACKIVATLPPQDVGNNTSTVIVLVPCPSGMPVLTQLMAQHMLDLFNWAMARGELNLAAHTQPATDLADKLLSILEVLRKTTRMGVNTPRFIHAALLQDIPSVCIVNEVYQYGQGRKSRRLESTTTDQTPNIGVKIARDKHMCNRVLARSGLPVPKHVVVTQLPQALQAAKALTYPVVVKPLDLDGGVGVAAGLDNDQELTWAFEKAKKLSAAVLVEKHIVGHDHRIMVQGDTLLWASQRVPGGVVGDGVHTVQALLDQTNADPRRKVGAQSWLKAIDWDEEAAQLLAKQGLQLDSVLPAGKVLALRRVANVSRGGVAVSVMDHIHPDNVALAVRAAQVLGLDMAGIDFISPDITQSWRVVGGGICEVNAQPQLGSSSGIEVHRRILKNVLPNGARIPTVVIVGDAVDCPIARTIVKQLMSPSLNIGWTQPGAVMINETVLYQAHSGSTESLGSYSASCMVLEHPQVDVAIMNVQDADVLNSGLATDRIDAVIVAGTYLHQLDAKYQPRASSVVQQLLMWMLPHCVGPVWAVPSCGVDMAALLNAHPKLLDLKQVTDTHDCARQVIGLLHSKLGALNHGSS